jgi:hypothetical protein
VVIELTKYKPACLHNRVIKFLFSERVILRLAFVVLVIIVACVVFADFDEVSRLFALVRVRVHD